jgi:hypothetical protein
MAVEDEPVICEICKQGRMTRPGGGEIDDQLELARLQDRPCQPDGIRQAQKEQMFSGVPGKRASDFALMSTRLDSKATAGPIPCAVSTGLTGVLTCLHVHIRVHLFTRKPNFFSCAASVPARGCPPHGFLREEGPASPILMRSRCRWSNGAAHLRGACADRTATMIRSCSWTVVRLRAPTSELM